jgi:hypothetical protein
MDIEFVDWSEEKNEELVRTRHVSFTDVVVSIEHGGLLYNGPHFNTKKYPHQDILIVDIGGYAHIVPYVVDAKRGCIFLKTIYPSRKETKKYYSLN